MAWTNLLVGRPHTLRRVVFPALPLRPLCRPKVRTSAKLSFSMAMTVTPCCSARLTSWLTASLSVLPTEVGYKSGDGWLASE